MIQPCDVAIIGGGPAGTTVGTLLKKYNPRLNVMIFERERFPRDHVGESQLPLIAPVLVEMGVWDKVEAAGFPVKIGATYRWGRTDDLWDFEFIPDGNFLPEARPAKYAGQRTLTAFQVDRAIYDDILLEHAQSVGCKVRQETAVRTIHRTGDHIDGIVLGDGTEVQARYYIDASGHGGLIRRNMGIEIECPSTLQNIAIWDYWQNAEWAAKIGVGGTRIQILSLPYGWIWFIPLGPERTSIGLVVPAQYYKDSGKKPEELYLDAMSADPVITHLTRKASREMKLSTTKDWSFIAERLAGDNWFLAGESAGFADPILSAGMTLAHVGGRDVAYAILALERKDHDPEWLRNYYSSTHRAQVRQHIRFADFWYTSNGVFSDLRDFAREMAADAGLTMTSEEAWRWLGQGGFIERNSGTDIGLYGLFFTKEIIASFTGDAVHYQIVGKTHFVADLEGAEKDWTAELADGRITRRRMYRRNGKILPLMGVMGWLVPFLKEERSLGEIVADSRRFAREMKISDSGMTGFWSAIIKDLEVLVSDGWVVARTDPGIEGMPPIDVDFSQIIHPNTGLPGEKVAA